MLDEELRSPFLTDEKFSIMVEERAKETGDTLLSAIMELLDEYDIDVQDAKTYISKSLRSKLEAECVETGMVVAFHSDTIDGFLQ